MNSEIIIFLATSLDRIVIFALVIYFFIYFIFSKEKKRVFLDFLFCFLSAAVALLISMIIKESFMIERPFVLSGEEPLFLPFDPYSFPSSHSSVFFAISACFFFLKNKIWIPLSILSILIASSRVLSGVHTFYDCFVGALIGIFISYVIYKFSSRLFKL